MKSESENLCGYSKRKRCSKLTEKTILLIKKVYDSKLLEKLMIIRISRKLTFHEKNQNFEILMLEYLLNTCKYHAKNFLLWFFVILNILKQVSGDLKC